MSGVLLAICAYALIQLAIAAWAARRTKTDTDYLVAGRKLGALAVGISLFATWFGSEAMIASSAAVAEEGLAGARIDPFGYGLGLLLMAIFVAALMRAGGYVTVADFLRQRFGPRAEVLGALAIALSAIFWTAAQLHALGAIIASTGGVSFLTALVGGLAIVLVYTLLGGLLGDVVTDIVQGVILTLGLAFLLALMVAGFGGVGPMLASVPAERLVIFPQGEPWIDRVELWLIPILGSIVAQEAISRALGAKSPEIARQGAYIGAGVYIVVGTMPILFGLFGPHLAAQMGVELGAGDEFLPSLAQALMPGWLYIIFLGALLSVIFSTIDSTLLAASAVMTENGYKRLRPHTDEKRLLGVARIATAAAAVIAFAIAASGEGVRELVLTASSIGGCILIPFLFGIRSRFGDERAALAAIAVHLGMIAWFEWVQGASGAFLMAVGAATLTYVAVAALNRPRLAV